MSPQEKLVNIKRDWEMGSIETKDTAWLISRVEMLESAIKKARVDINALDVSMTFGDAAFVPECSHIFDELTVALESER